MTTIATPNKRPGNTARQKELFEQIHDQYYGSTNDKYAQLYKEEYLYRTIAEYLGDSKSVIELASGIGAAAGRLAQLKPGLEISGCDISERAAEDFRSIHQRPCYVADLTRPFEIDTTYDAVLVMGGIHHLVADLSTAYANIQRLLKPGGRLIVTEPNADYFLNPVRRLWYRLDKQNFDFHNEHALSHDALFREFGGKYDLVDTTYFGGIANYLLVLNHFVRFPNSLKKSIVKPAMSIEKLYHKLPGKLPYASFIACWQLKS